MIIQGLLEALVVMTFIFALLAIAGFAIAKFVPACMRYRATMRNITLCTCMTHVLVVFMWVLCTLMWIEKIVEGL